MKVFERARYLTDPDGIRDCVVETHEGMAHFAGTGPEGKLCAHCLHWRNGQERQLPTAVTPPRPAQAMCSVFFRMTRIKSKPVPFDALACRHFEAHPDMINRKLQTYNFE